MRALPARIAAIVLAAAMFSVLSMLPGPANAATSKYDFMQVRIGAKSLPTRWDPCQARVVFKVNADLAGTTAAARSAAIKDVRTAFAKAGAATGIRFVYGGTTARIPTGDNWAKAMTDAEIVVAWTSPTKGNRRYSSLLQTVGNTVAEGGFAAWISGDADAKQALAMRGYVVVKSTAKLKPGFGAGVTRGEMLLHEIGHVLGLAHVNDRSQLMYPILLDRAKAQYSAGDLAGLAKLGRPAGCIPALYGLPVNDL